jgi:PKD repeat protein
MDISLQKPNGLVDVNMSIRGYNIATGALEQEVVSALVDQVLPADTTPTIIYQGLQLLGAAGDYCYLQSMFLSEYCVASFTYEESNGTVTFTDTSLNADYWQWDFGDGVTSTEQNPTHTYGASGDYSVTLTINEGGDSVTQVIPIPVIASISPKRGAAPLLVSCRVLR